MNHQEVDYFAIYYGAIPSIKTKGTSMANGKAMKLGAAAGSSGVKLQISFSKGTTSYP
jgi:hypothetical protein